MVWLSRPAGAPVMADNVPVSPRAAPAGPGQVTQSPLAPRGMRATAARRTMVVLLLLGSILLASVGAAQIAPSAAVGQGPTPRVSPTAAPATSSPIQAPAPRKITRDDWVHRIPLVIAAALFIIALDGAFVAKILADRVRERRART